MANKNCPFTKSAARSDSQLQKQLDLLKKGRNKVGEHRYVYARTYVDIGLTRSADFQ